MSAQHPAPWRAEGRDNGKRWRLRREFWAVLDRNEFFVAEGLDETTAREIVAAVNDRDRLRDLVRRLARVARDALDFAEAMSGIVPDNPERAKARSEITSLLREARAAIGEDKHGHT